MYCVAYGKDTGATDAGRDPAAAVRSGGGGLRRTWDRRRQRRGDRGRRGADPGGVLLQLRRQGRAHHRDAGRPRRADGPPAPGTARPAPGPRQFRGRPGGGRSQPAGPARPLAAAAPRAHPAHGPRGRAPSRAHRVPAGPPPAHRRHRQGNRTSRLSWHRHRPGADGGDAAGDGGRLPVASAHRPGRDAAGELRTIAEPAAAGAQRRGATDVVRPLGTWWAGRRAAASARPRAPRPTATCCSALASARRAAPRRAYRRRRERNPRGPGSWFPGG